MVKCPWGLANLERNPQEMQLTKIFSAEYDSLDKARNALDDLINIGLDREKVFLDEDNVLVKVMTPDEIEREVWEVLYRHEPSAIYDRTA